MSFDRPIVFFDLETTGTDVVKDRVIQIGLIRVVNGEATSKEWLVNPGRPIPAAASEVHGLTDEHVRGCPTFKDIAHEILDVLYESSDPDLCGFNIRSFDIPLLWEEFYRAGHEWDLSGSRIFDACTIFKRQEERTLSAAVEFYCGRKLEDAHDALSDTQAARDVFLAQLERYGLDATSAEELSKWDGAEPVDLAGKFVRDSSGAIVFSFGKHQGKLVREQRGYVEWMLDNSFPTQTKIVAEMILKGDLT